MIDLDLPEGIPLQVGISSGSDARVWCSGNWTEARPVSETDVYYTGSLTKQVVAVAIFMLEREGALSLDQPATHLLSDLPAYFGSISLRQLLHHTAGLPGPKESEAIAARLGHMHWTNQAAFDVLHESNAPETVPGTIYSYSNLGYVVLAATIGACGVPFHEFARLRLFRPSGMNDTEVRSTPPDSPRTPQIELFDKLPLSTGDGGMWSSARDVMHWGAAMNADAFGVFEKMATPGQLLDGTVLNYGGGVGIREFQGVPMFSHGGSFGPATAKLIWVPERQLVIAAVASGMGTEDLANLVDNSLALAMRVA
ncbi:serine hydrolase domain-containing protein [Devosia nitrariae]|uniref:Beta-lactamase-related domain-containing protein n=1 Tax=Devosia nitrariae TaxID=2071872 RepID=A0ABQ5WAX2_9HYPH|nr:serine hydrolase domain-containing protein [Devosia nitrariae]GLQ57018.1 hypothetical protein GCM10010862_42770 [Devosia nitrariae]